MTLDIGARPGMNNPGDLTVSPRNLNLYSAYGQTGVYYSPNTLDYPTFGSPDQGFAALVAWINRHVFGGGGTQATTPYMLADLYGNGSTGPLVNTAANPHIFAWMASLERALGISGQDQASLTQFTPQQIAVAITKAEGTFSTFGDLSNGVGGQPTGSNVNNNTIGNEVAAGVSPFGIGATELVTDPGGFFNILGGAFSGPQGVSPSSIANGAGTILSNGVQSTAGVGAQAIGSAVSSGVSAAVQPLTDWLGGLTSTNTVTRVSVGIVAVLLLLAGIFFLANNRPTNITLARPA